MIEFATAAKHNTAYHNWHLALRKNDIVRHVNLGFGQKCQMSKQILTTRFVKQFLHKIAIVDEQDFSRQTFRQITELLRAEIAARVFQLVFVHHQLLNTTCPVVVKLGLFHDALALH